MPSSGFLELVWWWLVNVAGDREAEAVARMLYLRERPAARFLAEEVGPVPWAVRERRWVRDCAGNYVDVSLDTPANSATLEA